MRLYLYCGLEALMRTFLTPVTDVGLTASRVRACAAGKVLSDEDRRVLDVVVDSLESSNALPFDWSPQEQRYVDAHGDDGLVEYLVYRYKMCVYPRDRVVAGFPTYLLIEPVSSCNLRCVMCFQVDKTFTRKPYMGVMDVDLFKRVVDEAHVGGTKAVTMASRGEPTLHKHLPEMLDYTRGKFIDVKLNTNATKLTEELSHRVLQSGLTELVFSIEAEHAALYEKIRVGGKFTEVLRNIERFRDIRAKHYPDSTLTTTASGVFFSDEQDATRFEAFWRDRVDLVATVECENRWNTYENPLHPELTHPCTYLWERMYVWWDGRCNPCDVDYKSHLQVGDLSVDSIHDVWHGVAYTALRRDHADGGRSLHPPCDRCGI